MPQKRVLRGPASIYGTCLAHRFPVNDTISSWLWWLSSQLKAPGPQMQAPHVCGVHKQGNGARHRQRLRGLPLFPCQHRKRKSANVPTDNKIQSKILRR